MPYEPFGDMGERWGTHNREQKVMRLTGDIKLYGNIKNYFISIWGVQRAHIWEDEGEHLDGETH